MSYDIDILTHDVDGNQIRHEVVCGHTYNLGPMWMKALPEIAPKSPYEMDGMKCRDLIPHLEAGLKDIRDNPARYRALSPSNGWGTFDGFRRVYIRYLGLCCKHPSGVVRWS